MDDREALSAEALTLFPIPFVDNSRNGKRRKAAALQRLPPISPSKLNSLRCAPRTAHFAPGIDAKNSLSWGLYQFYLFRLMKARPVWLMAESLLYSRSTIANLKSWNY